MSIDLEAIEARADDERSDCCLCLGMPDVEAASCCRARHEKHAQQVADIDALVAEVERLRAIVEAVEKVREQIASALPTWDGDAQHAIGTRDAYRSIDRLLAAALSPSTPLVEPSAGQS